MEIDNKEILIKLGLALRQARKEKGLTLLDLEIRTGINEAVISKIENGRKNSAFTTLVKLAAGLDLPLSELLINF